MPFLNGENQESSYPYLVFNTVKQILAKKWILVFTIVKQIAAKGKILCRRLLPLALELVVVFLKIILRLFPLAFCLLYFVFNCHRETF